MFKTIGCFINILICGVIAEIFALGCKTAYEEYGPMVKEKVDEILGEECGKKTEARTIGFVCNK